MSFISYILRSDQLEKDLLVGSVYGNRKRGRPKTRISDNIKEISGKELCGFVSTGTGQKEMESHGSSVMNFLFLMMQLTK